jgi:hypothetical protein
MSRGRAAGVATVEFALLASLLLMLAIPVFCIMWNVLAQTVATNAARELANLAARTGNQMSMSQKMQTVQQPGITGMQVTEVVADSSCVGSACTGVAVGGGGGPVRIPYGYPGQHIFFVDISYDTVPMPSFLNIAGLNGGTHHARAIF